MAIPRIELSSVNANNQVAELLDGLYATENSAAVVVGASAEIGTTGNSRVSMRLPWIDTLERFVPDRATELGGTAFFADMPPHIDPHPKDRLKVLFMEEAAALARFTSDVPANILDVTNELPGSDYTKLLEQGVRVDETTIAAGDFVCFLGSVTLHQFVSIGLRKSYINSYRPL